MGRKHFKEFDVKILKFSFPFKKCGILSNLNFIQTNTW